MNRSLFVALLLAFLCCVLSAPVSAQTTNSQINTLCAQCHDFTFLQKMTAGNAYNCNFGNEGLTQCGWVPLITKMQNDAASSPISVVWPAADVASMISYLETQQPVALPVSLLPGTAGVPYGPLTLTGITNPGYAANPPGAIPGGTPPFTWAATSGLPSGMTLNSAGVLSGTPASQGIYTLQITIQDSASPPTPVVLTTRTLVINSPGNVLSIAGPASLSVGIAGISYGPVTFTATGGSAPYTWTASGLPAGLAISPAGVLSGAPQSNTQGSYNPQFTVKDSNNATVSVILALTVNPELPPCTSIGQFNVSFVSPQPTSMSWSFRTTPESCGWTVSARTPTVQTITPSSGNGGGILTATFAPNNTDSAIIDTITLASGAVSSDFQVLRNPVSCSLTPSPSSFSFPAEGGTQQLSLTSNLPGCKYFLFSFSSVLLPIFLWTGSHTFTLTAGPNTGPPFTGTLVTYGLPSDLTIPVVQGGLSYPFPTGGQVFSASAGSGSTVFTLPAGLPWTATTYPNWITLTGPSSGIGSGTLNYQVTANPGADRSGTITVAGFSFIIQQEADSIPGLNFIGSMAHLAAEENWTTTFTLVNKSAASTTARLSFFGDAIDPTGNGPLTFPVAFPPQTGLSGPLLAASFDQTLAANASLIVNSAGAQTPPVLVGSAQLAATTSAVDGFAIFHQNVTTQEAVVPMETRNASSYLLAFDNTNGLVLGVAVENLAAQNAVIPVIIRDDTGVLISAPGTAISLGANGHTSFVLTDTVVGFPVTANIRGTIEFDTPSGGRISVLGLRFTPPNNALTTIPALANVGTGGGSIAHLASGGDGWQTTFVLVNTGTSAAPMTLSFFADQTGAPLSLPISFPQPGAGNATVATSVTRTLGAGATLLIASDGAPQLLTGSAQLTTPGNISGFVIFRHNGQEAVVPLESRNAIGYIIAFDNTNGTATGIAVNAVSAQAVNVPVSVRDEAGTQIAIDTIALNPNGHTQFTLVTDKYPATANIRGTIEFDRPANSQIGALGIRIPTGAAHTYTTLPAFAALTVGTPNPMTLTDSTFYGGPGDQYGYSISIQNGSILIGAQPGQVIQYTIPPVAAAASASFNGFLGGLTSAGGVIYATGSATPPACGATDNQGTVEGKTVMARYDSTSLNLLGCQSRNFFPYTGGESYNSIVSVPPYLYASGTGETCGYGNNSLLLSKFDASGTALAAVGEPGINFVNPACIGNSNASRMGLFNSNLYLVGFSNLSGEDGVNRPVLMKYGLDLARQWKARPADNQGGMFAGVTAFGGAIYAVGYAVRNGTNDFLIEKYDEAGNRIWSQTSGGPGDDELNDVVAVGSNLYAVGFTTSQGAGGKDIVVLQIDPNTGNTIKTTLYGGANDDIAQSAATDGTDLYVVGTSNSFSTPAGNQEGQNDVILVRYKTE